MRATRGICLIALFVLSASPRLIANRQTSQLNIEAANTLFQAGKFAEAEKLCTKLLNTDPQNVLAAVLMGRLALMSNKLDVARKWLTRAIKLDPPDIKSKALLAEVYYRRDDFHKAAPLLRAIGREAMAKKLESFKGTVPYQVESQAQTASLKFVQTDPLPVIQVRVNGGDDVNFIIDTGGPETIIDSQYAKSVGAREFGSEAGIFAGGKQSAYQHAIVDSLTLGNFRIKNVPVHIQDTRQLSGVAHGKRVDGILGTVLLYHFLSTLDYPRGELVLQRKTKESLGQSQQLNRTEIPFWMAGDHYVVAWGSVNSSQPLMLFVDTGAAGVGFTCPYSTIKEAGIKLQGQATEGLGGGGKVQITPFVLDDLTLGEVKREKIVGVAGAFPPTLENMFGFRIGGLISHSFFRPFAVTFDFTRMRLFLEKGNP